MGAALEHRLARFLAIGNQKGGCGKTCIAIHVAAEFASRGISTCVVDMDPGWGATAHLGFMADLPGTYEVCTARASAIASCIAVPKHDNLWLLPSSRRLEGLESEQAIAAVQSYGRPLECFAAAKRELGEAFDLVIMDTPPGMIAPTRAALVTADDYLGVLNPDRAAVIALHQVMEDIDEVRTAGANRELRFVGALLNKMDHRVRLDRDYREQLEQFFTAIDCPGALLSAELANIAELRYAREMGTTLFATEPSDGRAKKRALTQIGAIVDELTARLGAPTAYSTRAPARITHASQV